MSLLHLAPVFLPQPPTPYKRETATQVIAFGVRNMTLPLPLTRFYYCSQTLEPSIPSC